MLRFSCFDPDPACSWLAFGALDLERQDVLGSERGRVKGNLEVGT